MPVFDTGYDTTAGQIYRTNEIEHHLRNALASRAISDVQLGIPSMGEYVAAFVMGNDRSEEAAIPPMIHSLLVKNYKGRHYLVTDARYFRTRQSEYMSEAEFDKQASGKPDYVIMKNRALLTLLWLSGDRMRLRSRYMFAASVFANWLTHAITRAYALDYQDQATLSALSYYYYWLLFDESTKLTGEQLDTAVIHTIKATKLTADQVYGIFEKIPDIRNISDYCKAVREVLGNVRLKDFNLTILLTLVRNTWFGVNGKDFIAAALEHPPTWLTIVYATANERSFKNSGLYSVIEVQKKHNKDFDEFMKNFMALTESHVAAIESIAIDHIEIPEFRD